MKNNAARDIARALARLAKTDGRPRARKNARLALNHALRDAWREADAAYPALRPDGSAIERREPRGARCPACGAPMASFSVLARHATLRHWEKRIACWCGFAPAPTTATGAKYAALGAHLRAIHARGPGQLAAHATLGGLGGSPEKIALEAKF